MRTEVVSAKLLARIGEEPGGYYSVNIVLKDRVDLEALDAELTVRRAPATERSREVINALKEKSLATQHSLLKVLQQSSGVEKGSLHSYWIANAVFARITAEKIAELSQRNDIAWIGLNGPLAFEKLEKTPPPPSFSPDGIEPGLEAINAPAMWAMGYTGYGQVAFTSDTGIDPTHPALATRYRGLYVPKEQTWFEIDGTNFEPTGNFAPFDCGSHGTHVSGTILGLDRIARDTIGVAFNAQWIGAPILCGIGTEDNVAAFQWSLDPDGDPATVEDMPDVINNSWYDPNLDTADCFSVYIPVLEAMEVAGIAVVFSAGNQGPDLSSISPPHNININEVNSFTVAAVNGNQPGLVVANFSSRGPSDCGGDSSLLIKPEVAAPGVSVRSCVPGPDYDFFSGTSMAAPHVSGAILLLKEAFPDLTGRELKLALYHTCKDLGDVGEDNDYGMGIIDVLAAYHYLVDQGHTPVSPYRANDVLLVNLQTPYFSCENEIRPILTAENGGTDTLTSFEVLYEAGGISATHTWLGELPPGEQVTLHLPPLVIDAGTYELETSVENPNGVPDERPLNNLFRRMVTANDRTPFQAVVEGPIATVCEDARALLRGVFPFEEGSMDISWSDTPGMTDLLHQGEAFITPPLSSSTTYYALPSYRTFFGPEDQSMGLTDMTNQNGLGLTFEVYANCTLQSVKVFFDNTGSGIIVLLDQDGEILEQKLFSESGTQEMRVNLDWELSPGIYQLVKNNGKPLSYNTTGAVYPTEIENIISITGTTDGQGTGDAWYHFYDWEVEFEEPCGPTPVLVEVMGTGEVPSADFALSADTVYIDLNETVLFANTSTGAEEWYWNFGDGSTSTEESPEHMFGAPGRYEVSLTAYSADGCSDSQVRTIDVLSNSLSSVNPTIPHTDRIEVYPNPVSRELTIDFDLTGLRSVTIHLMDVMGRMVQTVQPGRVQKETMTLQVDGLAEGVYFLVVETEEEGTLEAAATRRVVISR